VELNEYDFPDSKLVNIQDQFEKIIDGNYFLNRMARDAYRSYLHAYSSHSLKDVFDVNDLDLQKSAVAFGLKNPPRVNLSNFCAKLKF
jgi:ATP-dependent RNA helicase DDX18/HAS1